MEFRKECFVNLNIWACDAIESMQSINTVEYPTLLCKSRCARETSPKYHFQHQHMIFFEITRDSYASASLSLSLYYLLSKFANSLDPEDPRRLAKPNQGQTGIPRINHVSERPTLRPMPRKNIIEPWHGISNNMVCGTSKASYQPVHMYSLIRAFANRLNILWVLSYWLNIVWSL